jgi:hypothetical protein
MELWIEGYSCTGQSDGASLMGKYDVDNIHDAVKMFQEENPVIEINFRDGIYTSWGCRLFDNEVDARKSFG